jgi:hypothetical protein
MAISVLICVKGAFFTQTAYQRESLIFKMASVLAVLAPHDLVACGRKNMACILANELSFIFHYFLLFQQSRIT